MTKPNFDELADQALKLTNDLSIHLLHQNREVALTALQAITAIVVPQLGVPIEFFAERLKSADERMLGTKIAPAPSPAERAACIHCRQDVALVSDVDAIRTHSMTCSASPVVQELQRLRRIEEAAIAIAWRWDNRDVAKIAGTDPVQLDDLVNAITDVNCPNCGGGLEQDMVDVGVGEIPCGPLGCPGCHWSAGDVVHPRGKLLVDLHNARHELGLLRAAAPVMLTVLALLSDEADLAGLREIGIWYGEQHPDHLETWVDAEKARKESEVPRAG